jgi:hypothetical protein
MEYNDIVWYVHLHQKNAFVLVIIDGEGIYADTLVQLPWPYGAYII